MDRWINKVAVVTGASFGIGEALVKDLVKKNVIVVGLAKRVENMRKIKKGLKNEKNFFHPIKCDISKTDDIFKAFHWIEKNLKSIDILVNNAEVLTADLNNESSMENLQNVIDVHLIGFNLCTTEAVRIMTANNTTGHIININSISVDLGLEEREIPAKVTTIFPKLVDTPSEEEFEGESYIIVAEDFLKCIIYALSTPPHIMKVKFFFDYTEPSAV